MRKLVPPPRPPYRRVIREYTEGTCKICHSTEDKKYIIFGKKIGCINEQCPNYKNSTKNIRKRKLKKLKRK